MADAVDRTCEHLEVLADALTLPGEGAIEEMARLLYKHDSAAWIRNGWESDTEGLKGEYRAQAHRWLIAVYAVDRAEERAATVRLREALAQIAECVEQFLREMDPRESDREDYTEMFVSELRDRVGDFRQTADRALKFAREVLAAAGQTKDNAS